MATQFLDKTGLSHFWSKIKAELNKKIDNNAALLTTNNFRVLSGYSGEGQSVYISKIDNALYCADKRYNVSAVVDGVPVSSSNLAFLFNGDYENKVVVAEGKTAVITFDFSNLSGAKFPNYPYGYIYVSFYYIAMPDTITGRVYNNYSSQGVGWKDITFTRVFGSVYRARQSYYGLQTLEITITGKTNGNYKTEIAQIEMHLDRPNPSRNPFLSKYNAEELYYNLTAPSFTGRLIGNADSASAVNGHTVNSDVPANAVFTDTTYSAATQSTAGLMSSGDKTRLDGIATGAEVNQNAFSNVKVGSTTIAADSKTDTLELVAGSNVTLTPDATNDKVTIAATGTITGITTTSPLSGSGTSGSVALSHAASGVTAASKGDTSNQTPGFGSTFKVLSGTVNATGHLTAFAEHTVKIPNAEATASTPGLMSAADKMAVDGFNELFTGDTTFDGSLLTTTLLAGGESIVHYGVCSTAAATTAKTVSLSSGGGFSLVTGAWIAVKFSNTNTGAVASLTLNVNSTGAKNIKYRNANLPSAGTLEANRIYLFVYDGTYWQIIGDLDTNTTYSNATTSADGLMSAADKKALDLSHYGTCSVATAVKTVACTNFVLTAGAWIAVKFTATNTAGSFTLNVNSTGAKSVSLYGSSSGLANKFLSGHTYLFIYDGSSYWQTVGDIDSGTTYSTMTQTQATSGTGTTGMLISPKVLSDTIADRAEYVAGDTLSITTGMICQGTTSGSTNTLSFFVPFSKACKATSCSCTNLSLLVRSYDGIPYARSGSSGGTYTQLGSSYVNVWANGASKRTNEVNSIACTPQENGMMVQISFVYNLAKASGNTSAVTANRPAAVSVQGTFTFS